MQSVSLRQSWFRRWFSLILLGCLLFLNFIPGASRAADRATAPDAMVTMQEAQIVATAEISPTIQSQQIGIRRTPPDGGNGIPKPDNFLIHLPFETGISSHLRFYSYGSSGSKHFGADYYAIDFDLNSDGKAGDIVYPVAPGKVVYAQDFGSGYGNMIMVEHSPNYTNYVSLYAHLQSISVTLGSDVTLNTPLGAEGKSGEQDTVHLHFALRYCESAAERRNPSTNANCKPVVPEPFLGVDVYEGLGWWRTFNTRGTHNEEVTSASRPINDIATPTGHWNASAVPNGAIISPGNPVVFDIHYEDAQNEIGEIRLTAHYNINGTGWAAQNGSWGAQGLSGFDSTKVWRIIARCDPYRASPQSNCGQNDWRFTWDPYPDTGFPLGVQDRNFLRVPWLPKALVPASDTPIDVCVSFDIFDRAGNPLYSPGGTQCNFNLNNEGQVSEITNDNQARIVRIMPFSSGMPSADHATFVSDVTLPNGTVVTPGEPLVKTWRVRNSGTSTWDGYKLIFVSGDQMSGPSPVDIPYTPPGAEVDISVPLLAPDTPARGDWQILTPDGGWVRNGQLWVILDVEGSEPVNTSAIDLNCTNCLATVSPGQTFRPTIRATVNEGQILESRGDMLRHKSGELFGAWPHVAVQGAVNQGQSYDFTFYADNPIHAPAQEGTYESKWQVWRNGNWAGEEYTLRFTVSQSGGNNRPPNRPTLTGPGDWAVYQGTQVVLTAQHNGDPDDGDNVTEYYFDIFESAQNANSGWISSNTWSPTGLGFNGYQWRVKVRDNHGNESDWSEQVWHFNILNNDPEIYDFHSETCREPWGGSEKICFCAQTNAGTLKVMVNMASDGSDNGEWRVLNELGTPNYNCSTDDDRPPNWGQLEGASGDHLVRLYARREGGWANAAYRDITVHLPAERRPNWPPLRLPLNRSYVDSQTVHFDWEESLRTTTYRLEVSDISDFSNLLIDQTFPYGTTEYDYTFSTDYETLYWRVIGIGPYGTNQSDWRFHIDVTPPESSINTLPPVTTDTKFTVNWSGHDARSGVRWYHVQMRDISHPDSAWEDWLVNTTKTAELFQGQPGHSYAFRVRAMDEIGNWEDWPADTLHGDTYTLVDPSAAPPTAWWNDSYAHKRNLVILNNDNDTIPVGFPMPLHFDATTTPTAAEIYNASLAANKGDDVRIVYNNATELHRFVQRFTSTAIDIWFPLQAGLGGGATNTGDYQIYYRNAGANTPPANVNDVFLPKADGNTMLLAHFQEGSGNTVHDSSGRTHNGTFEGAGWIDGSLGFAGLFNGTDSVVNFGNHSDFNVGAMTLETWILVTENTGSYERFFDKATYHFNVSGSRQLQYRAFGAEPHTMCPSLELNKWYHVAATYNGSNRARIYLNGQVCTERIESHAPYFTSAPLLIGTEQHSTAPHFPGYIQHVRVSNIERTDFPYAKVDIPPAVEAGIPINPPSSGTADLALTNLTTYPSLEGGLLVVAAIENQGDAATQNNFYTDLYVDHLPTGSGDFSGSLQFWVNAPIAAGATVTLTTVLTETGAMQQQAALSGAPAEVELTLYAQVDSTGVIGETDDQNNITGAGVEVCLASSDAYEGDDSAATATLVAINTTQPRNFDSLSDQDWIKFQAQEGVTYTLRTTSLGIGADTYLYLYDTDQTTLLAANDDYDGTLASQISWVAPRDDTFYVLVRHWNPNVGGCGTRYTLSVRDRAFIQNIYLPLVLSQYDPQAVHAVFGASPTAGSPDLVVQFTDLSTGPVSAWLWDFGDGSTGNTRNPLHEYTPEGVYTVKLTVTGPKGNDTTTKTNYITVARRPNIKISDDAGTSRQTQPRIAADTAGNVYVVWTDERDGTKDVYYSWKSSANGWSANTRINDVAEEYQDDPDLVVSSDGTVYAAWNDGRDDAYGDVFFSQRPAGGSWDDSIRVNDEMWASQHNASLALDNLERVNIVWQDWRASNYDIYFSQRATNGVWTASTRIDDDSGSADQNSPHLAIDKSGNLSAVWEDSRNGNWDIYYSYRPENGTWTTNVKVNDDTGSADQKEPAIAVDASGRVYVLWTDWRNGNENPDIYFSWRSTTGVWSANQKINNDAGTTSQWYPQIVADASGNAHAVWLDNRTGPHVYYAYRPTGGVWQANKQVDDGTYIGYWGVSLALDSNNNVHVVWEDDRSGNADIYHVMKPDGQEW